HIASFCFPQSAAKPPRQACRLNRAAPRLPRPAYNVGPLCQGIKGKALWLAEGRCRRCGGHCYGQGGGAAAAAAIMSALRQSAICGLEERKSLIAARPAKDIAPRHKARRTG